MMDWPDDHRLDQRGCPDAQYSGYPDDRSSGWTGDHNLGFAQECETWRNKLYIY